MDRILIFQFARIYNLYHHPISVLLRGITLLLVVCLLGFSWQHGFSLHLPIGLLLLFGMIQIFLVYKFTTLRPQKRIEEISEEEALQACTLPAASLLLQANHPSFLSTLYAKKEVQFVLAHIPLAREKRVRNVDSQKLVRRAYALAYQQEKDYITVLDIFGAYLLETEEETKQLFTAEIKKDDILTLLEFAQNAFPKELTIPLPKVTPWGAGIGEDWVSGWKLETKKYTQNFTKHVFTNPPISVGREKELSLLTESLAKNKQSNVLLIGQPGVGKKEIVASFAYNSFIGNAPRGLRFLQVLELLSGSLVAGATTSGELEERLGNILKEIEHTGDVVLFIPEIQNIAGAGSDNLDVTGVLLPHLLEDTMRVVATSTPENFKAFLEKKSEFTAAFEKITVLEPSKEEAIPMLLDASLLLEKKHGVSYGYQAIIAAVGLSKKYMPGEFLPGKAITLLDEAGARARIANKRTIDKDYIVQLLEEKLPIKIAKPTESERALLLHMEDVLHRRVIGQEEAIATVAQAMRRLRSGLSLEDRPAGVFLFLGPTGVGKTETAKTLAFIYFGSEEHMIRLDMSEYQDAASIDRLIETLSEQVRKNPFSLILLDEFEKADRGILDIFLSVFDDGRLVDLEGRVISFVNSIIIATSNAGAQRIHEEVAKSTKLSELKQELLEMLQEQGVFKPELLNRFDSVVLFEPLTENEIEQVTQLMLEKLTSLFEEKDITFQYDARAVQVITEQGFDPTMGARPLRRFIQDHVEDLLSQKLLKDEIKRGDTVVLSVDTAQNLTLQVK